MKEPPSPKAKTPVNLLELLRAMKKRPMMYLGYRPQNRVSIWDLKTFIDGFRQEELAQVFIRREMIYWMLSPFGFACAIAFPMGPWIGRDIFGSSVGTMVKPHSECSLNYLRNMSKTGQKLVLKTLRLVL
jgi:hypothetical protein